MLLSFRYRFYYILIFLLGIITSQAQADLRQHKITVGMYNTYSIKDGNLGRVEPDLKEVWEGDPTVSGYEACNVTMHYWPRPYDLPSVDFNQNPYAEWWKNYMQEAYDLTNQNGEVRLKVIVGPLYSYYEIYKGDVFDNFIKELCLWEKESKYQGMLAGWYLVEEPMGSGHNFDPDINNAMADKIKEIERLVGVPYHKTYVDVALDGLYYSHTNLAKFTRPADVVMISSSTYLWTTSGKQPVYEPNWKSIHGPMKIARDIIYADRSRYNLKKPEIHVVLEARDPIGNGQPTNWEIRQQIHTALSHSQIHNDPPADGIWFFWWSEIAKNAKDNSDDWNYGRRVAEAIQAQVPRSTFAGNLSIRKGVDPEKTQFRFPKSGNFNPNDSCIPYELAESGNVRIEILNERRSIIKRFDMKYQPAGSMERFGGPYWYKGNNQNGTYIFKLYLNSNLIDEQKVKVQWSIIVNSPSHQVGIWSRNNVIDVQWEPPSEEIREMIGYSAIWSSQEYDYPDDQIDFSIDVNNAKSDPLSDGNNHYFHITSTDDTGYWSPTTHYGPFFIDTTSPSNVKDISSETHQTGKWSNSNIVRLRWNPAEDETSGIKGYSIVWDNLPGTMPDEIIDISSEVTIIASEPLSDGRHFFHIRSVDNAGNWASYAIHFGPFLIDTITPDNVNDISSISHSINKWSNNDIVSVNWKPSEDNISGIAGYSIIWDNFPDTMPDESIDLDGISDTSPRLQSGKEHYFHVRSVDMAGNWSITASHIGPFLIDTQPPQKIAEIYPVNHKPDEWSSINQVILKWDMVKDDLSGVDGYQWGFTKNIDDKPIYNPVMDKLLTFKLDDGAWYIHIRAIDRAGNLSEPSMVMLRIDTQAPEPPKIRCLTHPNSDIWYPNPSVDFEWFSDDSSDILGYSLSWDMEESTIPIEQPNSLLTKSDFNANSSGIWFFHIRSVDGAGNWSKTSHYKVQIDPSAPLPPKIISDINLYGEWTSRDQIKFMWETPYSPSGIAGYSYILDNSPLSIPDELIIDNKNKVEYSNLSDGSWFFHCRAKSISGIWGQPTHFEIKIDKTPPQISIDYPKDKAWNNKSISEYSGLIDDNGSGIDWDKLYYQYNNDIRKPFHSDVKAQDTIWLDRDEIPHIEEGIAVIQVIAYDKAGNLGISKPVEFRIDRSVSKPVIISQTHPDQDKWYNNKKVSLSWTVSDSYSGIDGYSWTLDNIENTIPRDVKITGETHIDKELLDGINYFHIKAIDNAGNWGDTSHYRIKIDTTAPTAHIKISGLSVIESNPPIVRSGTVKVYLLASEPVIDPILWYKPASAIAPIPIKLSGTQGTASWAWDGVFDVDLRTGDGKADFFFSAMDEAKNIGNKITNGESFYIDTLIKSDSYSEVLCVAEPKTKLIVPIGAINHDMRIEIAKIVSSSSAIAVYDIIAYNNQMKKLNNIKLNKPIELTFDSKYNIFNVSVYFWDGVKWNRIQDSLTGVKVDFLGRFALMESSIAERSVDKCWASPNPFTPNDSRDASDRTIFHISSKKDLSDLMINIYDIKGRLIKRIENGNKVWDGRDEQGRYVEGGLYIFQIHIDNKVMSGTVVVLR